MDDTMGLSFSTPTATEEGTVTVLKLGELIQADSALELSHHCEEDRLSNQPTELVTRILSFLDAKSLALVGATNTRMHCLAGQELLWKDLCKNRWADKKHHGYMLHPFVEYKEILGRLSTEEKRDVLRRRFQNSEVDDDVLDQELLDTVPYRWDGVRIFEARMCGKWQASYAAAEMDSTRQRLSMAELNTYEWWYYDNWNREFYGNGNDNGAVLVKFFTNGVRGNVEGPQCRPRMSSYQFNRDGSIQVGQYPRHSVPRRLADWGWEFHNPYVTYTSAEPVPVVIGNSREKSA
ncbi:hypothetical protein HDU99_005407 [Rhizoclosmatium hyalinum]|nr:hypothetical protein HDU99_005407 [Rhizoclosmatium hyalinum]